MTPYLLSESHRPATSNLYSSDCTSSVAGESVGAGEAQVSERTKREIKNDATMVEQFPEFHFA